MKQFAVCNFTTRIHLYCPVYYSTYKVCHVATSDFVAYCVTLNPSRNKLSYAAVTSCACIVD